VLIPGHLILLAPDLPNPVQYLTRNAIIPNRSVPVSQSAQLPLHHEDPDPLSRIMEEVTPSLFLI
jgi:hypothetical protein